MLSIQRQKYQICRVKRKTARGFKIEREEYGETDFILRP